jgi:hypothetical protein
MRLHCILILALFSSIIISCKAKNEKVSRDEAVEISHRIDSTISKKHPHYINELLNESVFAKKVASHLHSTNSAAIMKGIKQALNRFQLGDKILESMAANGKYELVKIYEKEGTQHLLFRLFSDEGLNYHDLELCKRNGKIGIADFYIYLSGENFSETLAALLTSFDKSVGDNEAESNDLVKNIRKIRDYADSKDYESAYKYYHKLPLDIQNQRTVQIAYLMICKEYDEDEYVEGLLKFKRLYPDDPNIDLLMMDAYIIKKEIPKAMAAIDNLDKYINSDPFLDYFRALISNIANNTTDARTYLERLYKNYPGFDSGVLELINNYIQAGMNEKANSLIKVYEQNENFDQESLKLYLYTQPQFQKN